MNNYLYCGAAKRNIDPPEELMPNLFCVMPMTHFQRNEGGLYVRAIVIQNAKEETVLFISYELDGAPFPQETLDELSAQYGIPQENIFLIGDHSHEVPVTGERRGEPQHSKYIQPPEVCAATTAYEELVLKGMREAVAEALANLKPAKLGYGFGESSINTFREMDHTPLMPLDRSLFVLKIEDMDGNPIAFLLNYSMHNSCVKMDDVVTADFEGCVCRLMEYYFPGCISVWTISAHGDIMPRQDYWNIQAHLPAPSFATPYVENNYFKRLHILSLRHVEDAMAVIQHIQCQDMPDAEIRGTVEMLKVPTSPVVENADGSITCLGGDVTLPASILTPNQRGRMPDVVGEAGKPIVPFELRMHLCRIGQLAFMGIGGKLYNQYKFLIRKQAPTGMETVVLSQDSSMLSTLSYVPDDEMLLEDAKKGRVLNPVAGVQLGSVGLCMKETTQTMFASITK
ncbi:MAG: hypothetical protein LUG45_11355 [Clostridiales bacterium]|nr:hypothetical protein [Clostridiales bacterium]